MSCNPLLLSCLHHHFLRPLAAGTFPTWISHDKQGLLNWPNALAVAEIVFVNPSVCAYVTAHLSSWISRSCLSGSKVCIHPNSQHTSNCVHVAKIAPKAAPAKKELDKEG